jgi:hypothetical protein
VIGKLERLATLILGAYLAGTALLAMTAGRHVYMNLLGQPVPALAAAVLGLLLLAAGIVWDKIGARPCNTRPGLHIDPRISLSHEPSEGIDWRRSKSQGVCHEAPRGGCGGSLRILRARRTTGLVASRSIQP